MFNSELTFEAKSSPITAMEDVSEEQDFGSSELGTKSYWDNFYELERKNYSNHGDEGEIWFGEESLFRVCQWIEENISDLNTKILDVGSANGATSIELRLNCNFTNILGVDYSEDAVLLAREIVRNKEGCEDLRFEIRDMCLPSLDPEDRALPPQSFGLILDKGTYDAISLSPENALTLRTNYIRNISTLLHGEGHFVLTSCNWTDIELKEQFSEYFRCIHVIPAPTFQFGGKIGRKTTSIVFGKK